MNTAVLYWITLDPTKDNIKTTGYVGVTTDLPKRIKQHFNGGRSAFKPAEGYSHSDYTLVEIKSLPYKGTRTQAKALQTLLDKEKLLRPTTNIGLNQIAGGGNAWALIRGNRKGGRKGIASVISNNPDHQRNANSRANRRVKSQLDGKETTWAKKGLHEKKTKTIHIWIEIED